MKEYDEVCQELTDDPSWDGDLGDTQAERHQAVHDAFVAISGGRRFGIVTELGWLRTQGNFDGGNLVLNQGIWRVGFVF